MNKQEISNILITTLDVYNYVKDKKKTTIESMIDYFKKKFKSDDIKSETIISTIVRRRMHTLSKQGYIKLYFNQITYDSGDIDPEKQLSTADE